VWIVIQLSIVPSGPSDLKRVSTDQGRPLYLRQYSDFELLPCCEYCIISFGGDSLGVWILSCRQIVPKRRHRKFRSRGITQKKEHKKSFSGLFHSLPCSATVAPKRKNGHYRHHSALFHRPTALYFSG